MLDNTETTTSTFEENLQYTTTSSSVLSTSFDAQSTVQPSDSISETYSVSSNTESTLFESEVTTDRALVETRSSTVPITLDSGDSEDYSETVTEFIIGKYHPELINSSTGAFDSTTDSGIKLNTTAVYEDTSLALDVTTESSTKSQPTEAQTTKNIGQVTLFSTAATSIEQTDASSEPNKETSPIFTSTNRAEVTTPAPKTLLHTTATIEQFDSNTESSGDYGSGEGADDELDTDDEDLINRHQSSKASMSTEQVVVVTTPIPTKVYPAESTTEPRTIMETSPSDFTTISETSSTSTPKIEAEASTTVSLELSTEPSMDSSTKSSSDIPNLLNATSTGASSLSVTTPVMPESSIDITTDELTTNANPTATESLSKSPVYETNTEPLTSSSYTTNSEMFDSSTENNRNDLPMMSL